MISRADERQYAHYYHLCLPRVSISVLFFVSMLETVHEVVR
jgi:hypothetical protein